MLETTAAHEGYNLDRSLPGPLPLAEDTAHGRQKRTWNRKMTNPHHSVYVVELDPAVRERARLQRLNPDADPEKPCVYVGMTGLDPEERFENHRAGYRASPVVRDFGVRLLPELCEGLENLPYELALRAEADLAAYLRQNGYFVAGGH